MPSSEEAEATADEEESSADVRTERARVPG